MAITVPRGLSDQTLHILHISDIHFKQERFKFPREKVEDAFLEAVQLHIKDLKESKILINALFVTGDVAWLGDEKEYPDAEKFLLKLIAKIDNADLRVYIVPGNHDIIQSIAKKEPLQSADKDSWNEILEEEKTGKKERIADRFSGYRSFLESLNKNLTKNQIPCGKTDFFYTASFLRKGCEVTILGLNSAWACQDKYDDGKIALGEYQISQACKSIREKKEKLNLPIALMHHPFVCFHEADKDSPEILREHCQLVFRGHAHKGKAVGTICDGEELHELGVGAGYLKDDKKLEIGFQFAAVDPIDGFYYLWPYIYNGKYFYIPNERSKKLNFYKYIPKRFRESQPLPPTAPKPVDYFVGRVDDLRRIEEQLQAGGAAGITGISGSGGIGKTELAKKYADEHKADYPGGIYWMSFDAGAGNIMKLEDAAKELFRKVYGEKALVPTTPKDASDMILNLVNNKKALLILDNVEDPSQLTPPGEYALIVTTRNKRIAESIAGDKAMSLDVLSEEESIKLLKHKIGADRVDENPVAANRIAELCGYLPLALDIAGAVISRYSEKPLHDFISMLESGEAMKMLELTPTPDAKDISIFRTFDLSIAFIKDKHPEAEKSVRLFKATSVCAPQGFAIGSVAATADVSKDEADEGLVFLYNMSLLERKTNAYGRSVYYLHPLIRQFADNVSKRNMDEHRQFKRNYLEYSVRFAKDHENDPDEIVKNADEIWQAMVNGNQLNETDKVRAIIKSMAVPFNRYIGKSEIELAYSYLSYSRLINILNLGYSSELVELVEKFFEGDREQKLELSNRGMLANRLGVCYGIQGNFPEAILHLKAALKIHKEIGDREGEASDLGNLGVCYKNQGEIPEAIRHHEKALKIHKEIGDRLGEANDLGNLGNCYRMKGEIPEAILHLKAALKIHKEIGNRQGEANQLGNLGNCYQMKGEIPEAIRHHKSALQMHGEIGYKRGEAADLGNLGLCFQTLGKVKLQTACWIKAFSIFSEIGAKLERDQVGGLLAELKQKLGEVKYNIMYEYVSGRLDDLIAEALRYGGEK